MSDKEKRRAPRTNHNSVVEIYDDGGRAIVEVGKLVDFSQVGACFSSPKSFAVGQKLRLRLRLLREGRLYISASVVRAERKANTNFYGIKFEQVHDVA